MEYPWTNLRYYPGGLGKIMKNFTQESQWSGRIASSIASGTLRKDKDLQFKAVVLWIKKYI
jgi:hypothetical protein